jgi:chromosome segregation ATPase
MASASEMPEPVKGVFAAAHEELARAQSESAAKAATPEQLQNQLRAQAQEAKKAQERGDRLEREREEAIKEAAQLRGQLQALTTQNKELLEALKGKKWA